MSKQSDFLPKTKVLAPEGWEDNLRAKLMKELPDGLYPLSDLGQGKDRKISGYTGKLGRISIEIALHKAILGYE